jgi:hypothetical protein
VFYRKMTTLRTSTTLVLGALAALVAGCGGSNEPPPKDPNSIEALMSTPAPSPTDAAPADVAGKPDESSSRLNKPQKEQMEIALRRGETKAAQCPDVVPGMPTGEGEVEVVFDGQKGRVTDVKVNAPFAGTPAEACIKRAFVDEIIVPFDGDPITVPFTVKIPAKAAAATPDKKPVKGKK